MKADRFWSEIGISQFLLDLFQFCFSMLWGTGVVHFGTRGIQIWTGSIPVSLSEMRKSIKKEQKDGTVDAILDNQHNCFNAIIYHLKIIIFSLKMVENKLVKKEFDSNKEKLIIALINYH